MLINSVTLKSNISLQGPSWFVWCTDLTEHFYLDHMTWLYLQKPGEVSEEMVCLVLFLLVSSCIMSLSVFSIHSMGCCSVFTPQRSRWVNKLQTNGTRKISCFVFPTSQFSVIWSVGLSKKLHSEFCPLSAYNKPTGVKNWQQRQHACDWWRAPGTRVDSVTEEKLVCNY